MDIDFGLEEIGDVMLFGAFFILLMLVAFLLFRIYRKKLDPRIKDDDAVAGGLSMDQAQEMYDSGRISKEEFSAMRKILLGIPTSGEKNDKSLEKNDTISELNDDACNSGDNHTDEN